MIQGTSAQVTKIAAIRFFKWLMDNNLLFIVLIPNLVHDEIMAESPKEIAEEIANQLQIAMEGAGDLFTKVVKLRAVPEIADYWKH